MYDVKLSLMHQTLMYLKGRFEDFQKNIKKLYDEIDEDKKRINNSNSIRYN